MKLSQETREILTHFSSHGEQFIFMEGKRQSIFTKNKSRQVIAEIDEEIPVRAGIENLKQFVSCMNSFDAPSLNFCDNYVSLSDNESEAKFCLSDLKTLNYPTEEINFEGNGLKFNLKKDVVKRIQKYLRVMDYQNIVLDSNQGKVTAKVQSAPNSNENKLEIFLGMSERDFSLSLNVAGIDLIPDSYELFLSDKSLVKLGSTSRRLTYFLAVNQICYK
jgi:hypothetical protein